MMLSAQPEPPAGFTERLTKRVRRRMRIRRIAETAAYTVSGIASFAAVAAACVWIMSEYAGMELHWPEFPDTTYFTSMTLPKMPELPAFSREELSHFKAWGFIAAAAVLLQLCDTVIRRKVMRKIRQA